MSSSLYIFKTSSGREVGGDLGDGRAGVEAALDVSEPGVRGYL